MLVNTPQISVQSRVVDHWKVGGYHWPVGAYGSSLTARGSIKATGERGNSYKVLIDFAVLLNLLRNLLLLQGHSLKLLL